MLLLKFYLLLTLTSSLINCFNISPIPNIILKRDGTKTVQNESRSAFFGYTINLRKKSVIIGAPRSQSVLNSQKNINETGTIYKCDLNSSNVNKECYPYTFDIFGNRNLDATNYKFENKEYQMLGASMDGLNSETNKFVVCAPNLKDFFNNYYYMYGICYWVSDTKNENPTKVFQIINSRKNVMGFAQQGFSVHVTENEEFLIGAPGAELWTGEYWLTNISTLQ